MATGPDAAEEDDDDEPDLAEADQLGASLDAEAVTIGRAAFRQVLRDLPFGADPDTVFDALRYAAA